MQGRSRPAVPSRTRRVRQSCGDESSSSDGRAQHCFVDGVVALPAGLEVAWRQQSNLAVVDQCGSLIDKKVALVPCIIRAAKNQLGLWQAAWRGKRMGVQFYEFWDSIQVICC